MGIKSFLFFDTYHETVNYPSHRDPAPRLHFSDYLVQVKDKVHLKYRNLTMACYPPATLMNSCCIYNQSIFSSKHFKYVLNVFKEQLYQENWSYAAENPLLC